MDIVWQKQAKQDVKNFMQNSQIYTETKIKNYINSLIDYTDNLSSSPYLGKSFCILKNIELRQLIFRMHRIFYYIENNTIYILAVVHTTRDVNNVIKYFKDYSELFFR